MLGAMRHKGFIPWDDDIDVAMPRGDYERLETLLQGATGKYVLETPNTKSNDFFYPFSKIYDTETTVVENNRFRTKRGIYLDIFPLDGLGDSFEECEKNFKEVEKKFNLLLTRTCAIRKGRSFIKNAAIVAAQLIPNAILNNKKLLLSLNKSCKKHKFSECKWVGNLLGDYRLREVMPVEIWGEPVEYEFEGTKMYGMEKAEEYLTRVYGDWRQLPPEEKRVSHHVFLELDLNKSYLK